MVMQEIQDANDSRFLLHTYRTVGGARRYPYAQYSIQGKLQEPMYMPAGKTRQK